MALMKWTEDLSVGVSSLDDQHSKMLSLLNALHERLMSGEDKIVLGDGLNQLINVTAAHIRYEEDLLARNGYPDSAGHRCEHIALMRQICGIRQQYVAVGPRAMTLPVVSFLKNGLVAHFRGADQRYRTCLTVRAVA